MAKGLNKAQIIGNVGQDPDCRTNANGVMWASVSVATDESYKDKTTGQIVPRTEWHRVIFSGRLAEIVGQYVKKGAKIYVEGKLNTRKWTDQSGQEKCTTEIRAFEMQMLDSRPDGQNQHQTPMQQGAAAQQKLATPAGQPQSNQTMNAMDNLEDDIPFMRLQHEHII